MTGPILLAYDGSMDARHAIATAGELMSGPAVVVHIYSLAQPMPAALPGAGVAALPVDPAASQELNRRAREEALAVAQEGVKLARAAGFDPVPQTVAGEGAHAVWDVITSIAEERDARLIVVGHRDLSWLAETLLGSVGGDLVRHATRPVLVVPAPHQ